MTTKHTFLARLLGLNIALALLFAQPALAQESPTPEETSSDTTSSEGGGGGSANTAVAVNTKDNSSVVKFAFQVRRVMNGVVDDTNAAVAAASCENCTTIAVAIQIVMVMNDPDVVTPTNLALALNVECTTCETLASAYQFVFSTGGTVKFTQEGWDALTDIRKAIHELLKADDIDIATFQAELDVLMDQVREVIDNELEPVGQSEAGSTGEPTSEPTGTPAPEESPTDGSSSTPEPEPTEEEPSPSPSE